MPDTLRGLSAALRLTGQPDLPVLALLRHRSASLVELAVVLDDEPVHFPLDRALLTDALLSPSSDGPVGVSVSGQQVSVEVAGLLCLLELPDVAEFLVASYEAAPTDARELLAVVARHEVHART